MSFDSRLLHTLVIERATTGAEDEYGQPTQTYATLATVPGLVQPKKVTEVAQLNQAGAVVSEYTAYMRPTDLQEADRLRIAAGSMAGLYEITGIRNAAGIGHHLEIDCNLVGL